MSKVKKPAEHTHTAPASQQRFPLNIVSFYQEKAPVKHNLQTQFAVINESHTTLQELLKSDSLSADGYTMILFQHALNLHFTDNAIKEIASGKLNNDVILFTSNDKNKLSEELISGYKNSEIKSPLVIISNQLLLEHPINLESKYDFLYSLEKVATSWTNVATDHADKTEIGKMSVVGRMKQSVSWYLGKNSFQKPWIWVFIICSLVALFAMPTLSRNAGISGDEFTQYEWADTAIIPYYTDGNKAALTDPKKLMYLYGSSFDTFTAVVARITGTDDVYRMRHFWNAIFGFFCFFFTSLIIKRLTGSYLWASIGLILLFFTPRLLGDAYNNPKDIPFALGYAMALYYALKYFATGGRKSNSHLIGLILGISLANSIRIGGLVLLPIVALIAGVEYIRSIGLPSFLRLKWTGFRKLLFQFSGIAIASYFLGILFWPFGIEDPFTNPFKALSEFTNFGATLRQLFEGKLYDSDLLPRYYLVKYIVITMPIVSLAGIAIFIAMALKSGKAIKAEVWYVVFAAVFPVAYIWIQKSNVYGGLRQILFVIPLLVAIAVTGFYLLQKAFSKQKWALAGIPAASLLLASPAVNHVVKNHPLEYIYFNELIGGVNGAYGYYEMDYYLSGLKQSSEWFLENVARKNPDKKYIVNSYGMDHVKYYCRNDKNVKVGFTRYDDRSEKTWDYTIFYNAYLDKERLLGGQYPPVGTVFTPTVDGKPMGLVIKRPSNEDFEGYQADRAGNFRLAIEKYKSYLNKDPKSNEVYFYLAGAYANVNNLDSAIWAAKKSLELYPEYSRSLFALNEFYMNKQDYDNAIKMIDKYLESRPKDSDAWMIKCQNLAQKGDLNSALEALHKAIEIMPQDARLYQLGAKIYQAQKDNLNLQQYYEASQIYTAKDMETQQKALTAIQGIYMSITGNELDLNKFK